MKIIKYFILFLALGVQTYANGGGDVIQPRVIIYNYPTGRYQGIVNWNGPVFAGYWDGSVIWRKGMENSVKSLFKTKNTAAVDIVEKLESIINFYHGKTFTLTDYSDPIETELWASGKIIRIVGDWRKPVIRKAFSQDDEGLTAAVNEEERKLWQSLPDAIRQLLISIEKFDTSDKVSWCPEKIILLLQSPVNTTQLTIAWPNEWPRSFVPIPNTHATIGAVFQGSMLDKLIEKFPDDGKYRAVRLDGEARFPSIRLIFPGVLEVGLEKGL